MNANAKKEILINLIGNGFQFRFSKANNLCHFSNPDFDEHWKSPVK